jgi:cysteine-S-conjugate beta-lyase
MHIDTKLTHGGRASAGPLNAVNPPLVRASTTVFDTLAQFKQSYEGLIFEAPRYGRSGTATSFELQSVMAQIENVESCIATASGLSAICLVLSAYAGVGKHILVSEGVYGPTQTFCEKQLPELGTRVSFFKAGADIADLITPQTSLVFIETPASLTMQMLDVAAICAAAHQHGVPVACDSSWGTPIFFNAHALGIDISIHAATKYINGHSDVMLGLITGSYAHLQAVRTACERYGSHAAPDACWLALRGLRTLAVRMQHHQASALAMANWLAQQAQVKRILFPALPGDPGYALWQRQFSGAAGPFTLELQACSEAGFERFIDGLQLFGLGTSWGGYESLVMPAIPHHLRAAKVLPDEGRLVRLHIGLENVADLQADLAQALGRI